MGDIRMELLAFYVMAKEVVHVTQIEDGREM